MKFNLAILKFLLLFIAFSACEDENENISYPSEGFFGQNLLQHDSVTIEVHEEFNDRSKAYSLHANIPEDNSLEVIIRQIHSLYLSRNWGYALGNGNGWMYTDSVGRSNFQAYGQTVSDGQIQFHHTGAADIEIYENGADEPTRVKSITWEFED